MIIASYNDNDGQKQKKKKKKMEKCWDDGNEWGFTVSVEEFHELVVGTEGEFLATEGFANDFVIG